jgi:hypothetical protein
MRWRGGDFRMAKKRISSVELSWLILEQLREHADFPSISLAVVADPKHGWRAVVAGGSRRYVTPERERRLDAVQKKLRLVYELANS